MSPTVAKRIPGRITLLLASVFVSISSGLAEQPLATAPRSVEVVVPEAHLTLSLPAPWNPAPETASKTGRWMSLFRRGPLVDGAGLKIVPSLGIVAETVDPDEDVIVYSFAKRKKAPFDVLKVYSSEDAVFGDVGGIGFLGSYTDQGGVDHRVYVLHTIIADRGIQLTLDATRAGFDALDGEFKAILASLRAAN